MVHVGQKPTQQSNPVQIPNQQSNPVQIPTHQKPTQQVPMQPIMPDMPGKGTCGDSFSSSSSHDFSGDVVKVLNGLSDCAREMKIGLAVLGNEKAEKIMTKIGHAEAHLDCLANKADAKLTRKLDHIHAKGSSIKSGLKSFFHHLKSDSKELVHDSFASVGDLCNAIDAYGEHLHATCRQARLDHQCGDSSSSDDSFELPKEKC